MPVTTFEQDVAAYYDQVVEMAADGRLSVEEIGRAVHGFVTLAVRSAMRLTNTGPEKKALVMDWVEKMVDKLIPVLPAPWNWAAWLGKRIIMRIIDGQVEAAYETAKKTS